MFESVPDFSDNTMSVFEEMIRRGISDKYQMVWWVDDRKKDLPEYPNTIYVDRNTFLHKVKFKWKKLRAKCLISCNKILEKANNKQAVIYMAHGTAVKSTRNYYVLPEDIDYVLVASEPSKSVMAYELGVRSEKLVALGYPRNDVLTKTSIDLHAYFDCEYKKIIVWYPTYRQHKHGKMTGAQNALPILHNIENAKKLNSIAMEKGVLLVIKPHFAQDIRYIKEYNFSNILFIDDAFFKKNALSSYEFVASCDALITDYSSVFYDFLLCDKPIAVAWEDVEEYKNNPGFAVDIEEMMKCANKVYDLDDLLVFIDNLVEGKDPYKNQREEICEWANYSTDGNNTARVVDFIIEKACI